LELYSYETKPSSENILEWYEKYTSKYGFSLPKNLKSYKLNEIDHPAIIDADRKIIFVRNMEYFYSELMPTNEEANKFQLLAKGNLQANGFSIIFLEIPYDLAEHGYKHPSKYPLAPPE